MTGPDQITHLTLENDLLTDEVRRLRAELAEATRRRASERAAAAAGHDGAGPDLAVGQQGRQAQALEDITWFVKRLDGSPLGVVLRRTKGFRVLMDRYGS